MTSRAAIITHAFERLAASGGEYEGRLLLFAAALAMDKFSTSLKLDCDLGPAVLTSISSYSKISDNYQAKLFPYQTAVDPRNDAGNAILFGDQTQKYRIANKAFIQELRLMSDGDGPFQWQAGLYF